LREASVVVVAGDGTDGALLVAVLRGGGFGVHLMTGQTVTTSAVIDRQADVALVDTGGREDEPLMLVEELRRAGVPTAVVGGRRPEERAAAEAHGANAYLVRPVVASELLATVRSLAPRALLDVVLRFGALEVDVGRRQVAVGERRVHLAPREFDLLVYLATRPGRVSAADRLLQDVWRLPPGPQDARTVAVHVRRIRQKLEAAGVPRCIETVKGQGYTFVADHSA
jgi:DNA-binding response OmpR family regulator